MTKKPTVVKLVSVNDKLVKEAEVETSVMEAFVTELDELITRYDPDVLHPHDLIAILDNTKVAYQLVYCISLEGEEETDE